MPSTFSALKSVWFPSSASSFAFVVNWVREIDDDDDDDDDEILDSDDDDEDDDDDDDDDVAVTMNKSSVFDAARGPAKFRCERNEIPLSLSAELFKNSKFNFSKRFIWRREKDFEFRFVHRDDIKRSVGMVEEFIWNSLDGWTAVEWNGEWIGEWMNIIMDGKVYG